MDDNVDQNGHADQNAQEEEGNGNQNAQGEEVINRPLVQLPRFGVVREYAFGNHIKAHREPINGDPVPVLRKYLRWYEAVAGYDILSVNEVEGANYLLSTLTQEEWQRASPAPEDDYRDFVRVFATGRNNVEYELLLRHGVRENEPPYYDLTHGWSRVVNDYRLREGDRLEAWGYRDVEGDRLRLELRFHRRVYSNQNVQEEGDGLSDAVAVSRGRKQVPPHAARTARVRLPRFLDPEQPPKTQRVPNGNDGGVPIPVLEKDLGLTDADHNLLSVSEADGEWRKSVSEADGEWRKASPTNVEDLVKVLATGPNDDEYKLRPRHRVLENEPPEYDLTHGWKAGNRVEAWGYRDIKDNQLRLKLKFIRDVKDNPNVQEENQEDGEGEREEEEEENQEEGEGEGGGSAAAAA